MQAAYAERYRDLWQRHWWWRARETHVLAWVARIRRRSRVRELRILDVGCGDGLFFDRLDQFGRVEGLEADASIVRSPRWRDRIRVGALGAERVAGAEYDLVLMLDVLEHIADDHEALGAARDLLRPGGHLLLTVPALPWLWSRHDEANEHFRRYDQRGLASVLPEAGFEVETVRYFFFWTVAPLLARRWLAPALGARVSLDDAKRLADLHCDSLESINHQQGMSCPGCHWSSSTSAGSPRPEGTGRGRPVAPQGRWRTARSLDYAVKIPPRPVNLALTIASRCEHALGRVVRWPIGSSLLAVARRAA